jgi:alcohol dehydrogenase class IV
LERLTPASDTRATGTAAQVVLPLSERAPRHGFPVVVVAGEGARELAPVLASFGVAALSVGHADGAELDAALRLPALDERRIAALVTGDGALPAAVTARVETAVTVGAQAPVRDLSSAARVLAISGDGAPASSETVRSPTWRLILDGADPSALARPDRLYGVLEAAVAFIRAAPAATPSSTTVLGSGGDERRDARAREARLGTGALDALADLLDGAERPAAIVSPSLDGPARALVHEAAGCELPMFERPPGQLSDVSVAALANRLEAHGVDTVLGVGGGTVLDAAKASGLRSGRRVILLPTTLSGAEQTGNAAIWVGSEKTVNRVGLAHAVVADPRLLAGDLDALAPTALHAVAHTLTMLSDDELAAPTLAAMASSALSDLLPALEDEDLSERGRVRLLRGAWNAALSIGLTGPKFGPHHALVHRLVRADRPHARLSAALLCATLARTSVYDAALARVDPERGAVAERLRAVAARWLPQLLPDARDVRSVDLASVADADRPACALLLETLTDASAA